MLIKSFSSFSFRTRCQWPCVFCPVSLLTPDAPGMPKPLKLQEQHKALFPLDKPVNEESGRKVAEWAAGGVAAPAPPAQSQQSGKPVEDTKLSTEQQQSIIDRLKSSGIESAAFKTAFGIVKSLGELKTSQLDDIDAWIDGEATRINENNKE